MIIKPDSLLINKFQFSTINIKNAISCHKRARMVIEFVHKHESRQFWRSCKFIGWSTKITRNKTGINHTCIVSKKKKILTLENNTHLKIETFHTNMKLSRPSLCYWKKVIGSITSQMVWQRNKLSLEFKLQSLFTNYTY